MIKANVSRIPPGMTPTIAGLNMVPLVVPPIP
jgi:hypothetical protein